MTKDELFNVYSSLFSSTKIMLGISLQLYNSRVNRSRSTVLMCLKKSILLTKSAFI